MIVIRSWFVDFGQIALILQKGRMRFFLRMNSVLCAGLKIATHLILCLSLDARSPQPACAMNGDFTAHIIDWNGSKWWPAREKVERVGTKAGACTLPSLQSSGQSPVCSHTPCSFIKLMTGVIINYIRTCNSCTYNVHTTQCIKNFQ